MPKVAHLFIDESGDFDAATDTHVVAGLLLVGSPPGTNPAELRRTLRGLAPLLPWPLHARVYNHPVALGLAALARGGHAAARDALDVSLARLAVAARDALAPAHGALLAEVDAAFAAGRDPRDAALRELNRGLRLAAPDVHDELERLARRVPAALRRVAAALGAGADQPCLAVAAARCAPGDAGQGDPYLSLLAVLVERAARVLVLAELADELHVRPLGRDVLDPVLGRRAPLHVRHFGPLQERLRAARIPLRVVPQPVARYDADVHPLLVLADFGANRLRRVLDAPEAPLATIERRVQDEVGAPARRRPPDRSNLAAAGAAWRRTQGTPAASIDWTGACRWAREQAEEWAP